MEAKVIIVTEVKSNKSENNVWMVAITGEEQGQAYCKSPYKAMRFAFMLKKQTGFRIEDASLKALSEEIAKEKAASAEAAAEAEKPAEQEVQPEEKPKKQRKPRKKAEPKVVQMAPEAQQELIAFL
ncbi:hypothetical protein [Prevotella sp. P6B1]|uniref:hypothetical protein n=1 Tax=Prevotella sp. P6B1 TaxID=1410613 RepID=UPI00051C6321|nr:hypothetical protein [Prevotella sp. P6B1]